MLEIITSSTVKNGGLLAQGILDARFLSSWV
jgi:hypothetical protein